MVIFSPFEKLNFDISSTIDFRRLPFNCHRGPRETIQVWLPNDDSLGKHQNAYDLDYANEHRFSWQSAS